MEITTLLLLAISLSMDAFSVAVTAGIKSNQSKARESIKIGFFFGLFQGLMPTLGYYMANSFSELIKAYDHWIAFILLSFIGGKMLYEAFFTPDDCGIAERETDLKSLLVLSVATSIDALAVGISFAALYPGQSILPPAATIAFITFLISAFGVLIGKKIGCMLQKKAEILGGLILVGIGISLLVKHLKG